LAGTSQPTATRAICSVNVKRPLR